jgi:hypothetical protein
VFKYKVYGLSLNLLLGLEIGISALITAYSLGYKITELELLGTPLTSA